MTPQRRDYVGRRRSRRSTKFDTTVIGSDGLALLAHSDVLAATSAALRTQLHGDAPLTVHIDGISGHIWNFVLQFIYSGTTVPTNALEAEGILFAGEALDIPALAYIGRNFKDIKNNKECVDEDGGYATDIVDEQHRQQQSDSHLVSPREAKKARPMSAPKRRHLNQSNQSNRCCECEPGSLVVNTELTDSVVRVPAVSSMSLQPINNPSFVTTINPSYVATTDPSFVATINPSYVATSDPSIVATINPSYVATPTTSIIQVFPENSQMSCRKRRCPRKSPRKCCPSRGRLWRDGCCCIRRRCNLKCRLPPGGFCCTDHYHCTNFRSCKKPNKCRTRSSTTQTFRPPVDSVTVIRGRSYITVDKEPSRIYSVDNGRSYIPVDKEPSCIYSVDNGRSYIPVDKEPSRIYSVENGRSYIPVDKEPSRIYSVDNGRSYIPVDKEPSCVYSVDNLRPYIYTADRSRSYIYPADKGPSHVYPMDKGSSYVYPMGTQSGECMVAGPSEVVVSTSPPVPSSSQAIVARQSSIQIQAEPVGWFSWLLPGNSADEVKSSWSAPDGPSVLRLRQGVYVEPRQQEYCCQGLFNPVSMPSQLYKCRSCGQVFEDYSRLRAHVNRQHASEPSVVCFTK